ncbi:MAG: hypothetical protein SPK00_11790 [Corynebacterium glucuronolyticum]|nr:hypothetical protein [Mycobacteriaceae bacterium]MDY5835402.1 hypothetical protein [Corynebacterium glucuronolyticum]
MIVSTSEMGLIQQMMEDAYASGEPKDHVELGRMWSDQVDLLVVPDVAVDKHTADVAETQVAVQRQERRACQVLWPTGIEICGAILDKYRQLGCPLTGWGGQQNQKVSTLMGRVIGSGLLQGLFIGTPLQVLMRLRT